MVKAIRPRTISLRHKLFWLKMFLYGMLLGILIMKAISHV